MIILIASALCCVASAYGQSDSLPVALDSRRFISPPDFEWLRNKPQVRPKGVDSIIIPNSTINTTASGSLDNTMVSTMGIDESQFYTYFGVNSSGIDMNFMSNRNQHDKMEALMEELLHRANIVIDSIVVYGAASPEGDSQRNFFLANERCKAVKNYFLRRFPYIDQNKILTYSKGEDWDGLRSAVVDDPNVPHKEEVLGILDISSSRVQREFFLRNLSNGKPWAYISSEILPSLRSVTSSKVYYRQYPSTEYDTVAKSSDRSFVPLIATIPSVDRVRPSRFVEDTAFMMLRPDTIRIVEHHHTIEEVNRPLWALKTNLLYWAALQPNIEAEFYFGKHWSLNLEYQAAWWNNESKHQYYQYTQFGPEGRYWFKGDGNFRGHYVGLHVGFGIYDLSWGNAPDYQGYQGEFAIALGFSYGYTWKLGKLLHLEAGFGFGYIMTEYRRYRYLDECYVYQGTERMQFLGPTKARLALQWRIGSGVNLNKKKKGGVR